MSFSKKIRNGNVDKDDDPLRDVVSTHADSLFISMVFYLPLGISRTFVLSRS